MSISLTPRQQRFYKHTCDIWNVTRTVTTGVPGTETYTLVQSGVPCYFQFTDNVDSPSDAGGIKRPTIFTTDFLHLPSPSAGVNISDGWIVKNTTVLPNGTASANSGAFSKALGAPRIIDSPFANKQVILCMTLENPPAGLS